MSDGGGKQTVVEDERKTVGWGFKAKELYAKYGFLAILVLMIIISANLSPAFLTQRNVLNVLRQMSIITIIAFGTTKVIISGMIDLSSGSVAALTGCLATGVMVSTGSVPLAIVTGVFVGALAGVLSGLVITKFAVPPFIMTLGMMISARGLVLLYTGGMPISGIGPMARIGQGLVAGRLPIPVLIMIGVMALSWVLMNRTRYGRYVYAIGCNEDAARASGVRVKTIKVVTFAIAGALTGLAGVILMARINSGQPAAGVMYELDAIATVVLGGTSLAGGIGTIQGTLVGGLIIGILNNILNLTNVSPYWQQILKGVVIVVAVILDMKTKSVRAEV